MNASIHDDAVPITHSGDSRPGWSLSFGQYLLLKKGCLAPQALLDQRSGFLQFSLVSFPGEGQKKSGELSDFCTLLSKNPY